MKYFIVLLVILFAGCFGPGLYSDSTVYTLTSDSGTFRSQSFPFFKYPVGDKEKKELAEFVKGTSLYKECIATEGHFLATYQEGLMGDLTIVCEGNGSKTTVTGTIVEENVGQFPWLKETGDK